jgi:2-(1,2-epoxy-1,2-dihydrophenyl)acetyl-CoA isomerase
VSGEQQAGHGTGRFETVEFTRDGGVARVALNRPDRMNAWSTAVSAEMLTILGEVKDDDSVRALLITGNGRGFCAGADLKDSGAPSAEGGPGINTDVVLRDGYHPIVTALRELEKPVVTAVNGPAAGAGVSLALAGDIVVAAESAYFLLAFTRIGLVPDGGSSIFVPARVGFARAAELALLADRLPAAKAVEWGLINFAWPDAEFAAKTDELVQKLASGPTRAYAGVKRELNHWLYSQLAAQLNLEADIQRDLSKSADFAEGVAAFNEKRPANFTGA